METDPVRTEMGEGLVSLGEKATGPDLLGGEEDVGTSADRSNREFLCALLLVWVHSSWIQGGFAYLFLFVVDHKRVLQ